MNKLRVLACLAIATTIGTLSLLILRADDQPAVISKAPVSAEAPAASVDSARAKSKIPDVSGIWLYNGEKLVAQFRPAEPAEAFDYRLVIDGQKSPYQLKWSAERKQFEAAFEADRGPGKLLLKPTCDGHAFRGLILVNGEPTHQELVRGVMDGQTVRRADKPAAAEQSDDVLVLETSVGLVAYNEKTRRWHQQTVGLPKDGSSRINHAINGRHFVSVHFDDQLFVFSSPADRWARKTISEKDMENVSIFHGGDEFSVQVGFTKYELTAAGDFVGVEALVPPTVAETDDAKTDPAMPDISGVWMFFQGSEPEQKVKITP
ncbi:MAG: hypothetical protein U0872_16095, partial [Planctomycetaceae bacterium]